ncbi:hypothetical protein HBB16_20230 [Pseudonocardia sp. MCCB 268]|nr:hypothetical protein [Pseudonocardia cytotoxica]
MSRKAGAPVRLLLTAEGEHQRDGDLGTPARSGWTTGVDTDGNLVAREAEVPLGLRLAASATSSPPA